MREAAGKSSMEALRALKRRLSDVVYRQMVADEEVRDFRLEPPEGSSLKLAARALVEEMKLVVDLAEVLDDEGAAVLDEDLVTGPGGQVGASAGSSAAGSNPDAGSSEKSLPGPARSSSPRSRRPRKTRS